MKRLVAGRGSWAWLLLGIFFLQVGWVLVVPPYGGLDEFDHAYRASSVGEGYVAGAELAVNGRGHLIPVPEDVVLAAEAACERLPYTLPDNCHATSEPDPDGNVMVASAAATYNPAYYAVVGLIAKPFTGASALYAMRGTSALLCTLVIGVCLWRVSRRSRTPWAGAGVGLALTPVVLYASTNVAPNGLEICAGILMWCVGLTIDAADVRPSDWALLAAAMALVATLHTTGPIWCAIFLVCFLVLPDGRAALAVAWRHHRARLVTAIIGLGIVGMIDLVWIVSQGTNWVGDDDDFGSMPLARTPRNALLWVFQTIGSVPFRDQHIAASAMLLGLLGFLIVLVLAVRRAARPERVVIGLMVLGFFGVALIWTALTYNRFGHVWQGRYSLPLASGLPILAVSILARTLRTRQTAVLAIAVWLLVLLLNVWGLLSVLQRDSGLGERLTWSPPPAWLLLVLGGLAAAAIARGLRNEYTAWEPVVRDPVEVSA